MHASQITLRGSVLPIGGLKEKVLAAHRAGIKKVLIPADNEKDIEEIPAAVLKTVELELVSHVDEVLKKALILDDPNSLFRHMELESQAKDDSPTFPDKVEDVPACHTATVGGYTIEGHVPASEILPQ